MKTNQTLQITMTKNDIDRFFSKISIDPITQCWNWTAAITRTGREYGAFRYKGTTVLTHRLIYAWLIGPVPLGVGGGVPVVEHRCDNPRCCNPQHLHLTSQRYNVLKGNSPTAKNAKKTHCIKGHLLPTEPNEFWGNGKKTRRCIICRRKNRMQRYYKNRLK